MEGQNRAPGGAPAPAAAVPQAQGKTFTMQELPEAFASLLSWLDPQEYRFVRVGIFHSPIARDVHELAKFLDTVFQNAIRAENRTGPDRISGAERDGYRDRVVAAISTAVREAAAYAKRAKLTQILQRQKKGILGKYGADEAPAPARKDSHSKPGIEAAA